MIVQAAQPAAAPAGNRAPRRQLSPLRVLVALALVAGAVAGGITAVRRATRASTALAPQWFAPYVDTTVTPLYPFEDAAASPARQIVLGFVVARQGAPCVPAWGSAYGLDEATTSLDFDRRLLRLRQHGAEPIVSFGGAANQELATACTDAAALAAAYRAVVERYDVSVVDLDIEGAALADTAATARRATALAALQQARRAAGHPLAVWLTLPVDGNGLTPAGQAVLDTTLKGGVAVAGVNAMTMNFGGGQARLRTNIEHALTSTAGQLDAAYRAVGIKLSSAEVWRRLGATPMIGLDDSGTERFDLDTAAWLVDLARRHGLGRLSYWSLNRDTPCGANIDRTVSSPHCSGLDQRALAFTDALAGIGRTTSALAGASAPDVATTSVTAVGAASRNPVVDDPAASPYSVWNADRSYPQGRKVVWHRNVYVALWFSHGEVPDGASASDGPVPWRLVGPVLPGEHPPSTTTIAPGTYAAWDPDVAYTKGRRVQQGGVGYEAKWWTKGDAPGAEVANDWDTPWQALGVDAADGSAAVAAGATDVPAAAPPATSPATTSAATTAVTSAATTAVTTAAPATTSVAATASASVAAVACPPIQLDPMQFADGDATLSAAARRQLDVVVRQLASAGYRSVTVIGRADARPSLSLGNEVLSTRRADAVASYLRSAGVSVPIAVDGRGDRDPVSDGSLAANRTVEIAVSCGTA